jgi:hypothetical protein
VDADLCGKIFLNTLRQAGLSVESIHDHFKEGTPDEVWLEFVGINGWVALSRNKEIRHNSFQTDRLMEFRARTFMLIGHATPSLPGTKSNFIQELADNFVHTLHKVHLFLERHEDPFIAKISRPEQSFQLGNPHSRIVRPGNVEMWLSHEQWLVERQRRRRS